MLRSLHLSLLLALSLLVATATTSSAAPGAFEGFVAGLAAGKASSWLDTCEALLTPGGVVRSPCTLTLSDLVAAGSPAVTLKVTANRVAALKRSQYQWRDATVEARAAGKVVAVFRVLEVSGYGNPDDASGGWHPRAAHWIRLIKDQDASALARSGKLPAPPSIANAVKVPPEESQDASDAASVVEDLKNALDGATDLRAKTASWLDDGAILIGSAPRQTLTGKSGGKAVRSWKLELAQRGGIHTVAGGMLGVAFTQIVGTTAAGKGQAALTFTYPAMVVYTQGLSPVGSLLSDARLVSFALVQ